MHSGLFSEPGVTVSMSSLAAEEVEVPMVEGEEGQEGRGGARVPAGVAAAGEEGGVEAGPTCCVCMEPWTCNDAHRICFIPCGHVYGRSCLEKWLDCCDSTSAKCPQCGERFEHKHLINLYAPGNLWDGCCRLQELRAEFESENDDMLAYIKSGLAVQKAEICAKSEAYAMSLAAKLEERLRQLLAVVDNYFSSMKAQMKEMAKQNATPMDLISFLERKRPELVQTVIRQMDSSLTSRCSLED